MNGFRTRLRIGLDAAALSGVTLAVAVLTALSACSPGSEHSSPGPRGTRVDGTRAPAPVEQPAAPEPVAISAFLISNAGDEAPAGNVGMDPGRLARVDSIILSAIADGATPGASLAIGRRGSLVRVRGYGRLDWQPSFGVVTDSTIYDLASLTKVIGTTMAAMILEEKGRLLLDAPVARYLASWPDTGARRFVTIRHLLTHTAGLPAGFSSIPQGGPAAVHRAAAAIPLEYRPGVRAVYSDLGMIVLGQIVERVSGQPLALFLEEQVFGRLGLRETGFNPRTWPADGDLLGGLGLDRAFSSALPRVAPTRPLNTLRNADRRGVVHDPLARALDGVAGNAGLFSSARDMAVLAQLLLDGGSYGGVRIVKPETVQKFTIRQNTISSWALGWDTPSANSAAGAFFSERSFGHTGYTGTSLWIHPERHVFVVLLTNRVNPTSANQKHVPLRRAVHDAVQLAITDVPVERRAD